MKPYTSIAGYLERFSLFSFGHLKVRWHRILNSDQTPFFHSHPFHYLSIVLWGSYTEQINNRGELIIKTHRIGSIILRRAQTPHRIQQSTNCRTLFFAWNTRHKRMLYSHPEVVCENYTTPLVPGIYIREINQQKLYCKFDTYWYIGSINRDIAFRENRLSIYQTVAYH